jgi:hypothetical protein
MKSHKKVIIYGFKHTNHTHHFIHLAVHSAFNYMGYDTHWIDETDDVDVEFFNDAIIYTEGWVTDGIPVANNSIYIIHHFGNLHEIGRFLRNTRFISNNNRIIDLRFFIEKYEDHNQKWDTSFNRLSKIDECTYHDDSQGTYDIIYQPWATDLLPHQIDEHDVYIKKPNHVNYIGTVTDGFYNPIIPATELSNSKQVDDFRRACISNNIGFIINDPAVNPLTILECKHLAQKSMLSPDIRDHFKIASNYIPCRIFKYMSYGTMPLSNSQGVYKFFRDRIIFDVDEYQLAVKGIQNAMNINTHTLKDNLTYVRANHTFVNRIQSILKIYE